MCYFNSVHILQILGGVDSRSKADFSFVWYSTRASTTMIHHRSLQAILFVCRLSAIYSPSHATPSVVTTNVTAYLDESIASSEWLYNSTTEVDDGTPLHLDEKEPNVTMSGNQEHHEKGDHTDDTHFSSAEANYHTPSPRETHHPFYNTSSIYSPYEEANRPSESSTALYLYDFKNHSIGTEPDRNKYINMNKTSKIKAIRIENGLSNVSKSFDKNAMLNVSHKSSHSDGTMLPVRNAAEQPTHSGRSSTKKVGFFWQYPDWDCLKTVNIQVKLLSCIMNGGIKISADQCHKVWNFVNSSSKCGDLSDCSDPEYFIVDVENSVDNIPMFMVRLNTTQITIYKPWLEPHGSDRKYVLTNTHFTRLSLDNISVMDDFNLQEWMAGDHPHLYRGSPLRLWVAIDGCHVSGVFVEPRVCRSLLRLVLPPPTKTNFHNERFSELPTGSHVLQNILVNIFALDYHVVFTHVINETDIDLYKVWLDANPFDRGPYVMQYDSAVGKTAHNDQSTPVVGVNDFSMNTDQEASDMQVSPPSSIDDNLHYDVQDVDDTHNISVLHPYDGPKDKSNLAKSNDSHSPLYHLFHPKKNTSSNNSSGVMYIIRHSSQGKYSHGKMSVHPHIAKAKPHGKGMHVEMKPPAVLMQSDPEAAPGAGRIGLHNQYRQWERPGAKFTQAHLALLKKRGKSYSVSFEIMMC